MREWLVLIILLSVPGFLCAQTGVETDEEAGAKEAAEDLEFSPEIEALLNETSGTEGYGARERCITVRSIRSTDVLDDRHIVFELPGKSYHLVQFDNACQRLRRGGGIIYEPRGAQLCSLDFVRAIGGVSAGDVGPPCSIRFYPVTNEQVALLREALKAEHQAEVDAYRAEKARRKADKKAEKAEKKAAAEAADTGL